MAEKVLVLGATGALGQYIVPALVENGFKVDAVAQDDAKFFHPAVNNIKGDCMDFDFRQKLLAGNYDGIVDFMVYPTSYLPVFLPQIVSATGHYIFLSSYRVYDDVETPLVETSPRLLDSSQDILFKNSDDYSIYKARGENVLASLPGKNWTIVRPAITYSFMRYQLVTLEAPCTVGRAKLNKPVILPEKARNTRATMSWSGDVAQMITGLLFNDRALGESFTVSTAEHHSWEEIAGYYEDICGLQTIWVDQGDYLKCAVDNFEKFPLTGLWQLTYDRLFDRVIDNSKILEFTGIKQENLMKLYDGLKYEISRCPADYGASAADHPANIRMDKYLRNRKIF